MSLQTTDTIVLDVKKQIIQTVRAKQYDNDTRSVNIKLVDGDEDINLSSYSVYAKAYSSKGRALLYSCVNNSNGTATLYLNGDILHDAGITKVEIVVKDGDDVIISSAPFTLQIIGSVYSDTEIISDPQFDVLFKLIGEAEEAIEKMEGAVAAEEEREANELVRQANEDARVTAEDEREAAETDRISAETTRIQNESTRVTAESERVSNEAARVTAENARVTAENGRSSAEQTRVSNENTRIANETSRQNAETSRDTAEQTRITNENTRIANESTRETNEADRVSAESIRVTNEQTRVQNETERQTYESERRTNEEGRVSAESVRVTNEGTRQSNETTRQQNETTRQANEVVRQSQEETRQTNINTALTDANTALTNANSALDQADDAIVNAQTASTTATRAAADATTALNSAEEMEETLRELIASDNLVRDTQLGVPSTDTVTGVATLDSSGYVPSYQLPSYVDDVLEGDAQNVQEVETGGKTATAFILTGETDPCTPESGKIYIDRSSNICFRWTGSIYAAATAGLTLGTTSSTAFPGDRGLRSETLAGQSVYDVIENDGVVTVYKNNETTTSFELPNTAPIADDDNENVTFVGIADETIVVPDGTTIVNNSGIISVKLNSNGGITVTSQGLSVNTDSSLDITDNELCINIDPNGCLYINTNGYLGVNLDTSLKIDGTGKLSINEYYGTEEEVNAAIEAGLITEGMKVYISDD